MIVTNKLKLPEAIVEAVRNDPYSRGTANISVTQLISPPRKVALEEAFREKLEEDASDRIWSLLGQAVHTILERSNKTGFAEQRFYMPIAGWTVSGAIDGFYENGTLEDYKVTSAYAAKGGAKDEWVSQLNCLRVLLENDRKDITIKKLQVVAILRDWSKLEASRDPNYPQAQVVLIEIPLWTEAQALNYMHTRVVLHQQARVELPECTDAERWAKPPKWALMKVGGQRAVKLYDSEADALAHAATDPKKLYVETRLGQSTRCLFYCGAAPYCTSYQRTINKSPHKQEQGSVVQTEQIEKESA